jgi:hypothetical protein
LSLNDAAAGIIGVPYKVNTGLIRITSDNVDEFLANSGQ